MKYVSELYEFSLGPNFRYTSDAGAAQPSGHQHNMKALRNASAAFIIARIVLPVGLGRRYNALVKAHVRV